MTATSHRALSAFPLAEGAWTVDAAQSRLGFKTRAMGLFPVKGRFEEFGGMLTVDAEGVARGELQVDSATLGTGIRRRDAHLRSKDFFYVEAHPQMTFDLTGLEPAASGTARLLGTLRIRDRNLAIDTPAMISTTGTGSLRIEGSFEIDHGNAGFEFKHLPRHVQIEVALTLEPAA